MAKESFEDQKIAKMLNEYFISVKIDREELPHIDSYYQKIYREVKGHNGGWPLSVLLDEHGNVFWIGSYLPAEKLMQLMSEVGKGYREDREKYFELSATLYDRKEDVDTTSISVKKFYEQLIKEYDSDNHGFTYAPKFPEAAKIKLLLEMGALGDTKAQKIALDILDTMALSGIYDQSEGGFFRYSVDPFWEIPHFEKMLYTQAELIPLYVRAYQLTKESLYAEVVKETIAMVQSRFSNNGLFYSASDAQSDGKEGAYFVYSEEELESLGFSDEVEELFALDEGENFADKYHLSLNSRQRPKEFHTIQKQLQTLRENKKYPFIDKKSITSWNAMMIEALYSASIIDPKYKVMAAESLKKLLEKHYKDGIVYHYSIENKLIDQKGLLEDYIFLISALVKSYQVTFDQKQLDLAKRVMDGAISLFYKDGIWFENSEGLKIKAELFDKYTTSTYGKVLALLQIVAVLCEELKYQDIANQSLEKISQTDQNSPSVISAILMKQYGVITLSHTKKILNKNYKELLELNHPYLYLLHEKREDYGLCNISGCFFNSFEVNGIKKALNNHKNQINYSK